MELVRCPEKQQKPSKKCSWASLVDGYTSHDLNQWPKVGTKRRRRAVSHTVSTGLPAASLSRKPPPTEWWRGGVAEGRAQKPLASGALGCP